MEKLTVTLKTITPLFLGGAEPNIQAELRAPSIKGALRFWYRAIDPEYKLHEDQIFGSMEKGQGYFLLNLDSHLYGKDDWNRNHYCGYDEVVKQKNTLQHSSTGNSGWTQNGNAYLGFSLNMKPNKRKAISAGQTFNAELIFRRSIQDLDQKRILAAIWFFGHVGGLGSRSRRGFGTVALHSWKLPDSWGNDNLLPIAHDAKSPEIWVQQFDAGLKKIKEWFPANRTTNHTVLNKTSAFYLFKNGNEAEKKECTEQNGKKGQEAYFSWEAAMDVAGKTMQSFRQRLDLNDPKSDYYRVKEHLSAKHSIALTGLSTQFLTGSAPDRTAFGLPLTFRYGSLKKNGETAPPITFQGVEHDRSSSPLLIRIVEINGKCHPFFTLLDAPLLASEENIADQNDVQQAKRKNIVPKFSYKIPKSNILQTFCTNELKPKSFEIKWP